MFSLAGFRVGIGKASGLDDLKQKAKRKSPQGAVMPWMLGTSLGFLGRRKRASAERGFIMHKSSAGFGQKGG